MKNKVIKGQAIPFTQSNIDTDAIIPKQYLKSIKKSGFGPFLFDSLRYLEAGDLSTTNNRKINPDFILNIDPYKSGNIIVANDNFGCGSSREHAVWALQEWGIKAVIGSTFGSIFYGNCIRNGLLPIQLSTDDLQKLIDFVEKDPESDQILIDLETLSINFGSSEINFEFDKKYQASLLEGLDEIQQTLKLSDEISSFEEKHLKQNPWL